MLDKVLPFPLRSVELVVLPCVVPGRVVQLQGTWGHLLGLSGPLPTFPRCRALQCDIGVAPWPADHSALVSAASRGQHSSVWPGLVPRPHGWTGEVDKPSWVSLGAETVS